MLRKLFGQLCNAASQFRFLLGQLCHRVLLSKLAIIVERSLSVVFQVIAFFNGGSKLIADLLQFQPDPFLPSQHVASSLSRRVFANREVSNFRPDHVGRWFWSSVGRSDLQLQNVAGFDCDIRKVDAELVV